MMLRHVHPDLCPFCGPCPLQRHMLLQAGGLWQAGAVPCHLQGSDSPHLVANSAFLAERSAKEAAEQKLATLRRTLAHKEQLLKDHRSKVRRHSTAPVWHMLGPCDSRDNACWLLISRCIHKAHAVDPWLYSS